MTIRGCGVRAVGEGQGCFDFALRFAALASKAALSMTKSWDSQTEPLPPASKLAQEPQALRYTDLLDLEDTLNSTLRLRD